MPSIIPCSAVGALLIKSVKAAFCVDQSLRCLGISCGLRLVGRRYPGGKPVIEVPGETPMSALTAALPMTVAPVLVIKLVGEDGEASCRTEINLLRLGFAGQSDAHKAKRCGTYE